MPNVWRLPDSGSLRLAVVSGLQEPARARDVKGWHTVTETSSPRTKEDQPTLGQLVSKLTETISSLVRDEIQLAQAQLTEKGKALGAAGAMFAVAGLFGLFGLGWLLHAAYLALAGVLPDWAAALIVAGSVLVIAAVAALVGKAFVDRAPAPETKENVQRDIEALKAGVAKGVAKKEEVAS